MNREQARSILLTIVEAILNAIKACPEGAPGGVLYAACMAHGISLEQYEQIMSALLATNKVRKQGELYFAVQ